VLTRHRLDAGPGDSKLASRLAALAKGRDPRILLEVVIALGRLRWSEAPGWLRESLSQPDVALSHAAMQTLRRSQNWASVLRLLDDSDAKPIRAVALRAVAGHFAPPVLCR